MYLSTKSNFRNSAHNGHWYVAVERGSYRRSGGGPRPTLRGVPIHPDLPLTYVSDDHTMPRRLHGRPAFSRAYTRMPPDIRLRCEDLLTAKRKFEANRLGTKTGSTRIRNCAVCFLSSRNRIELPATRCWGCDLKGTIWNWPSAGKARCRRAEPRFLHVNPYFL